jgi:hypothetical protein
VAELEPNKSNTDDDAEILKKPKEPRIHKSWLSTYLSYTSSQESPEDFHLWTGISLLAGVLDRNVYIKRGYGKLYPNFYLVLVSPTGRSKKTTCIDMGTKFLFHVDGLRMFQNKATPEGLIEYLKLGPIRKFEDGKRAQMCTAYVYASELAVYFGSQSYTSGLIELMTDLYDSRDTYEYNPKHAIVKYGHGIRIENTNVNFLGASNPQWLAKGFQEDSFGGGFMGRTIFIYSVERRRSDRSAWMEIAPEAMGLELTLLKDLQHISKLSGSFKIDPEAYLFYKNWYNKYEGNFSGRMGGYYERKPTHMLKLAMVMAVNFDDDLIITKQHMQTALVCLEKAEKNMAEAFAYISATSEARISQHIIEAIKENGGAAYRKDLFAGVRHLLRNVREFDDTMENLYEADIVRRQTLNSQSAYVFTALAHKVDIDTKTQKKTQAQSTANIIDFEKK